MTNSTTDKTLITVLVLAGGDFEGKTLGPTPPLWSHPLLLPAGSKLAIEIIRRFYSRGPLASIFKVVIDTPPPKAVPIRSLDEKDVIRITPQANIVGSLRASLEAVTTPWVLINPITTLPSRPAELATQIMIGERQLIREDWSSMKYDPNGSWTYEKKNETPTTIPTAPLTGIVCAPTKILAELARDIQEDQAGDLISIAKALKEHTQTNIVETKWHDLGHRATHAISRRSNFSSREFNNVRYCAQRDVIIKSSRDQIRLTYERNYLRALPQSLRRHFPALISSQREEESSLVMEAIPYPSLAELHLHWDLGPNIWLAILNRLKSIQSDFANAAPTKIGSSSWLYSTKLKTRWEQFKASQLNNQWWQKDININGRWFSPLRQQVNELIKNLADLERDSQLRLIHGDFCFNNILCDPLYTSIRLIDPRGEAGPGDTAPTGYGDNRYDLVKLFHSIGGHYDSIVNNLFKVKCTDSNHLELEIYTPTHQRFLAKSFETILMPRELSKRELNILTASLFFSMLPLHSEDLDRQLALAIRGMFLLSAQGA